MTTGGCSRCCATCRRIRPRRIRVRCLRECDGRSAARRQGHRGSTGWRGGAAAGDAGRPDVVAGPRVRPHDVGELVLHVPDRSPPSSSTGCGRRSSSRRPPASCSPPGSPRKNSATCSRWPAQHAPPSEISNRLFAFYDWCARADVPEVTRLARTIEAWWPQILAFIDTGITNARTEATNRMIEDAARIAFGFRNLENQRRRVTVALQADDHQSAHARVTSPLNLEGPLYLASRP